MNITKKQITNIIKEEIENVIREELDGEQMKSLMRIALSSKEGAEQANELLASFGMDIASMMKKEYEKSPDTDALLKRGVSYANMLADEGEEVSAEDVFNAINYDLSPYDTDRSIQKILIPFFRERKIPILDSSMGHWRYLQPKNNFYKFYKEAVVDVAKDYLEKNKKQ